MGIDFDLPPLPESDSEDSSDSETSSDSNIDSEELTSIIALFRTDRYKKVTH